ncbi:MAG: hypothetical protein EVA65_05465 [Oceanococcus sp.]|nr:MAG: hypothetical protein EVA65_05465 [Oceanococcus sp.]
MRIEDSSGKEITSLEEWAGIYANPQQSHQWKEHRSAYSVADFLLNHDGGAAIQSRVAEALGHGVEFERIVPEYEQRFDQYGRGRVHDLGVFGRTESSQRLFVGVEAKVDEPFGASALDSYLSGKAKQIVGISTKGPERIEQLLALHFKEPDPTMFDVRYQLLYATAGTLAAEADVHVMYVIVFKTPLYDESVGAENYRDYIQFMDKVGAKGLRLPTKEAIGHVLDLKGQELVCLHEYFQLGS